MNTTTASICNTPFCDGEDCILCQHKTAEANLERLARKASGFSPARDGL